MLGQYGVPEGIELNLGRERKYISKGRGGVGGEIK
jgi:hypothetical protein